ncbi:MAG: arylsulfatase, partial [Flavobacteriaceae bacterium]|nr:arylsulfatase [Flavobacteriaceae bacterium]
MKSWILIFHFFFMGAAGFKTCYAQNSSELNSQANPNIVVILSDDQGWGDFSIHGNTNLSTPNVDKIALEGARFENFYVQPVCSPTRAEFLTGRYHHRGGVYSTSSGGERLDLDEKTMGRVFKEAGYTTAVYGKWHNGTQYPYHPNGRGFDDFYGFASGHWGNYFDPMLEHNGKIVKGNGYLANDITDHAIDFIKDNKNGSFFLYVAFNIPHAPMQVPDKWYKKFNQKKIEFRAAPGNVENIDFTRAALAMCENIDWNVGRIARILDTLNLSKNTILVYFNDNGPNEYRWNGGMKGKKGSVDEGGVRSPLFVKWPGKIKAGKKPEQLAGAIDLLPTLADLAQIPYTTDKELDGISLKNFLIQDSSPMSDRVLINQWRGKISVRSQKYRLSHDNLLYDIENDRGQKNELGNRLVKEELLKEKENFKKQINKEDLTNSDHRPFLLGHPDTEYTHLPARDGIAHGNITRSNKFPNCSFFTNWKNVNDFISWDTQVLESGAFEVTIYYTGTQKVLNSEYQLSLGKNSIKFRISEIFNPPLRGMENDRVKRKNSYVKDFKPLSIGKIHLDKGKIPLVLKSLSLPEKEGIDVRLILFKRIRPN